LKLQGYIDADFESMKLDYLESRLDEGRISIVAAIDFNRLPSGKLTATPILYLRARNINRDVIDLFSMKTTCASLEDNRCHYSLEDRPSGGASLIPLEFGMCYSEVDRIDELNKWIPYQKVLHRIVKRRIGMSVYAKLNEDIENVIFDLLAGNTEGVSPLEIIDLKGMIPMLTETHPEQIRNAYLRYEKSKPILLQRKKNEWEIILFVFNKKVVKNRLRGGYNKLYL